ncbi:MAG: hypothetical protein HC901_03230 [Bdellovibrionaceae bacterium]|nr:hypothetical protein [Pseudobdellovibrionaceae bacterium]
MENEWGESGARLVLPIEILIESEYYKDSEDDNNIRNNLEGVDDFIGEKGLRLSVLEDPKYISMNGQLSVPLDELGAWKITTQRNSMFGTKRKTSNLQLLRFWIDTGSTLPSPPAPATAPASPGAPATNPHVRCSFLPA